jgi:pimeloyl-ACP methyl ester carboxylesterase
MQTVVIGMILIQGSALCQNSTPAPPPPGKLVDIGGYKLHIYCTGKGDPTVVLIAGGGDFSFDWSLVQPEVSHFARVCSYDRAGSAWSDLGPTPRTMHQEAYELHLLLKKAGIKGTYLLVGHSIGGLIARIYADQYPKEVVGIVLVDSTHEDTTLGYQGKLVRMRTLAKNRPVPPVHTMRSSPPEPPTEAERKQAEQFAQSVGPPRINPPFDKLPPEAQKMRLWALSHPKLSAATDDFFAEELEALYVARNKTLCPLGDKPLITLVGSAPDDDPNLSEELKQLDEEKLRQKAGFVSLSRNSKCIYAEKSGHHIQLDEPEVVISAIREVVEAVRDHKRLSP